MTCGIYTNAICGRWARRSGPQWIARKRRKEGNKRERRVLTLAMQTHDLGASKTERNQALCTDNVAAQFQTAKVDQDRPIVR